MRVRQLQRCLARPLSSQPRTTTIEDVLSTIHCVDDFERLARAKLEKPLYDYLASGAGAEVTLRENRAAFARYALRPRALADVSNLSAAAALFGRDLALPVFASPAGVHCLVDPGVRRRESRKKNEDPVVGGRSTPRASARRRARAGPRGRCSGCRSTRRGRSRTSRPRRPAPTAGSRRTSSRSAA